MLRPAGRNRDNLGAMSGHEPANAVTRGMKVKRTTLLGTVILLAPLGGCATSPLGLFSSTPAPAAQVSAAPTKPDAAPTDLASAIKEAQTYRKNGNLAAAAKVLSQLVLLAPDDPRVVGEYGKTLAGQGRSDDALAFLGRAAELEPNDWSLFSAQGVAYDQKGNYQAAQASYARALLLKPGEPSVLNNDALSHMQAGDLDGAEKLLHQAAPGTPEFPRIAQNLELVQKLKAAQSAKQAAAPPPASQPVAVAAPAPEPQPAAAPTAPVVATAPLPAPEPVAAPAVAAAAPAPAPVAEASGPQSTPPKNEPPASAAVAAAPEASPAPSRQTQAPGAIEALKADPHVVMQQVPKDDSAGALPWPLPAKPGTSPVPAPVKQLAQYTVPENPAAPPAGPQSPKRALYVQAGAYYTPDRAGEAASTLVSLGARVTSGVVEGREVYRVRIGPFLNVRQANAAVAQARALGRADLKIVSE